MKKEADNLAYIARLERRIGQVERKIVVWASRMRKEVIWRKYMEDFLLKKFDFDLRLQVELKALEEDGVCEVDGNNQGASFIRNESQTVPHNGGTRGKVRKVAQSARQQPRSNVPPVPIPSLLRSTIPLPTFASNSLIPSTITSTATGPVTSSIVNDRRARDVSITVINKEPQPAKDPMVTGSMGIRQSQSGLNPICSLQPHQNPSVLSIPASVTLTSVARSAETVTNQVVASNNNNNNIRRPAVQPVFVEAPTPRRPPNDRVGSKRPRVAGDSQVNNQVSSGSQSQPAVQHPPAPPMPVIVSTSTIMPVMPRSNSPEVIVLDQDDDKVKCSVTASSNLSPNSNSGQIQQQQNQYNSSVSATSSNNMVGSSRDNPILPPSYESFFREIFEASNDGLRTENADSSCGEILRDYSQMELTYSANGYLARRLDASGNPVLDFNVRKILLDFDTSNDSIDEILAAQAMPISTKKNITIAISDFLLQVYGINPPRIAKESMAESLFAFFPFVPKETWWQKVLHKNAQGSLENRINNRRRMIQDERRRLQRENENDPLQ